jgi:hypothetical protein
VHPDICFLGTHEMELSLPLSAHNPCEDEEERSARLELEEPGA